MAPIIVIVLRTTKSQLYEVIAFFDQVQRPFLVEFDQIDYIPALRFVYRQDL